MKSGYEATMAFLKSHGEFRNSSLESFRGDWGAVVRAAYEEALVSNQYTEGFPGASVADRVGWFPGLRQLEQARILEKVGPSTRGGSRAYYHMPDPDGVACALRELGLL